MKDLIFLGFTEKSDFFWGGGGSRKTHLEWLGHFVNLRGRAWQERVGNFFLRMEGGLDTPMHTMGQIHCYKSCIEEGTILISNVVN